MTRTVLVTGATGTVGRHVADGLADTDAEVRLAARNPGNAAGLPDEGDRVAFDFEKPETWGVALADVDGLFLMRPPAVGAGAVGQFVDAASRVGVERVAYLSTLGAATVPVLPHRRIERRIAAASLEYTFLRASFFAQNLLEVHGREIAADGEIAVPAGGGATSFVDARDVGAVGAAVLTEPGHEDRAYDLTGPAALDYHAVATVATRTLDWPVAYADPSILAFVRRRLARGDPLPFVAVMVGIYTSARLGFADRVADGVERVLGRPPRDLEAFFADYAGEFREVAA